MLVFCCVFHTSQTHMIDASVNKQSMSRTVDIERRRLGQQQLDIAHMVIYPGCSLG